MSVTQLASMFLGRSISVIDNDTANRLRGVGTSLGNIVHITDGQSNRILGIITARDAIDNMHYKSLIDVMESFELEVLGGRKYDEYLTKGNRLIVPAEETNEYIEFVIDEVEDFRSDYKQFEVTAYASYLDLQKAKAIEPFTRTGTAREHLIQAFVNTEYDVGYVESNKTRKISFENWTNPFEYAQRVAREFDLELNFRVEHNGMMITQRYVDALDRVGDWRGREVTFGKDLQEIRRIESGDIYTALIGLGPEREDGSRLQVLVEDFEALERWGRPIENPQHLIGVYEPQSEREEMTMSELRQYTQTELDKRKNSAINWEISFLDLEHLLGHENKKIRFGDTIRIKDTKYEPNLFVQARIFEMRRNVFMPEMKEYKLGDFIEFSEEEVHSIYALLKRELAKKAGIQMLLDYAEPKKIESDTPPEIKEGENPIWVDTSKTPKVPHVVIAGQWVKMTPTTASEVNAYTRQEVNTRIEDVNENIYNAVDDMKAYAENADNIKQGIIDVGAVPLRTSITGARIEWDGANGLVQYDMQGNPVSWLDLDGNAHFANAFLSGRVEATSGYFGKNQRVTIGDDGLTIRRPDGAIYMENGMTHMDYNVSQYEPKMMGRGEVIDSGDVFRAFSDEFDSWYRQPKGALDGRGYLEFDRNHYKDVRDADLGYTIRFQRYEFIHTARYLRFTYQAGATTADDHRVRMYEVGTAPPGTNEIYFSEDFTRGNVGTEQLIVDLGKPSYQRRTFDFRVGWLKQWGTGRTGLIVFRVRRVVQTDFI